MITGFKPSTLGEELTSLGFHLKENLSPKEIETRYLKGHTDEDNAFNTHFACAVVE